MAAEDAGNRIAEGSTPARRPPESEAIRTVSRSAILPFLGAILLITAGVFVFIIYRSYAWPLFIALLFYAGFERLNDKFVGWFRGNRTAAASLSTTLVVFTLVGPVSLLVRLLILQLIDLATQLKLFLSSQWYLELIQRFPGVVQFITSKPFFWVDFQKSYLEIFDQYSRYLDPDRVGSLVGGAYTFVLGGMSYTVNITVTFLFGFIILFFLFRNGPEFYQYLEKALPFPREITARFTSRMKETILAVLLGNTLIAILQGTAVGIGLFIAGVPNALLWGFVATIFSIIPVIGTGFVWFPASLYLYFIQESLGWALFLAIYGISMYLFLENILKPRLLDRKLGIHPLFIFFAILGGLAEFGVTGVFLGPLIVTVFTTIWSIYHIWGSEDPEIQKEEVKDILITGESGQAGATVESQPPGLEKENRTGKDS